MLLKLKRGVPIVDICDYFELKRKFATMCRLKYLVSQSDIFSHFGQMKGPAPAAKDTKESEGKGRRGKAGGGGRRGAASDELDEDEQAILKEAEDEDEEGGGSGKVMNTILLKQPTCISGGAMR